MAAGSNPLARPLVFATQACSAVSGSTHTGLISGSHRAPLITLLMFCAAKTDRETDRQPARQVHNLHFQLKGALALTIILSLRVYVSGVVTHFSHFVACNALTASYMLSLSSKCTPVLAALSINPPSPNYPPHNAFMAALSKLMVLQPQQERVQLQHHYHHSKGQAQCFQPLLLCDVCLCAITSVHINLHL